MTPDKIKGYIGFIYYSDGRNDRQTIRGKSCRRSGAKHDPCRKCCAGAHILCGV
jgi:hypothetical protein